MSGTTSTGTVYLLFPDKPGYYSIDEIYNPSLSYDAGTKLTVPQPKSLISGDSDEDNVLYIVESVNGTTYESTLIPVYNKDTTDGYGLASVVSYGNVMFRAYYDTRSSPVTVTIDRVVFYGASPSTYQLVRYPNTTKEKVISAYYSTLGSVVSSYVPMDRVAENNNIWYCQTCNVSETPADDEELLIRVFSETGALVATCSVFAKASDIVNSALTYRPSIADIKIKSSQLLADASGCYIFEKQSIDDLDIAGTLVYTDGSTRDITIDKKQTFLYGTEDYVAAYSGQTQNMMLKYYLSYNEVTSSTSNTTVTSTGTSIARTFTVKTIANSQASPIKISVIPVWNATKSQYDLRYFYYSTDHTKTADVTDYVTIRSGSYSGSNFLAYQTFTFGLDMSLADPTTYGSSTTYIQSTAIKLQPPAALERFIIRDSVSSTLVYGADSSASRRPILYYDTSKQQYFIPSSVFSNLQSVLQSFYYNATPPYDTTTDTTPAVPTHFTVRSASGGSMLTAVSQDLNYYTQAFSLSSPSVNTTYVGSTLVVEFIAKVGDQSLILYGVPVDVAQGTYIG